MSATRYENAETAERLNERFETEVLESETDDGIPDVSDEEAHQSRRTLAREDAPDTENPRPDLRVTAELEFRGHPFEFAELGDTELEATDFHDVDEGDIERGTEIGEFVYKTLGEKGVGTDEEYWRQYSLQPAQGEDGLIDLFNRLIVEFNEDVDPEDLEAAGNSPGRNADSQRTE